MRLPFLILLAGLAVPSLSVAQRGGGQRGGGQGSFQRSQPELQAADLEGVSPARLVEEHRKDLALDETQIKTLAEIRRAFDAEGKRMAGDASRELKIMLQRPPELKRPPEDKPVTKKDSLSRAALEADNQAKADKYETEVTDARRRLSDVLLQIRTAYDATTVQTVAVLRDDQKPKITPLLERASEELTLRLRRVNIR